jgi:hypothetical protein
MVLRADHLLLVVHAKYQPGLVLAVQVGGSLLNALKYFPKSSSPKLLPAVLNSTVPFRRAVPAVVQQGRYQS